MLYQQLTFIRQRYLINNIDDVTFEWQVELGARELHPIQLAKNVLEGTVKTVVTQDADGLDRANRVIVPYMV